MTWTSLDDSWDDDPDLQRAMGRVGDAAVAMWVRAVTYCNRKNTDGLIPVEKLRSLTKHRRPDEVIAALVECRKLAIRTADEYEIPNFLRWNKSKAQVDAERAKKADSGRKGGEAKARNRGASPPSPPQQIAGEPLAGASPSADVRQTPSSTPSPLLLPPASPKRRRGPPPPRPFEAVGLDPDTVAAELRRHPRLAQLAEDPDFAASIVGRAAGAAKRGPWVLDAIGEAAADCEPDLGGSALRKHVRKYCDNARAPRDDASPRDQHEDAPAASTPESRFAAQAAVDRLVAEKRSRLADVAPGDA